MLAKLCSEKSKGWDFWLPMSLFGYRDVPQSITGFSPVYLLYRKIPLGPPQLMNDNWTETNIIDINIIYKNICKN